MRDQENISPRARIEVSPDTVDAGRELVYRLVNEGQVSVMFGAGYGFEILADSGWEPVNNRIAFAAWAAILAPGDTGTLRARVPTHLHPARYRLCTSVRAVGLDGRLMNDPAARIHLSAEFEVPARN